MQLGDEQKNKLTKELVALRQRVAELETAQEQRQRAEETSRFSEARLRQMLTVNRVVIFACEVRGETLVPVWTSPGISYFGYTPEETLTPTWWADHLHPDDRVSTLARMPGLLQSGHLVHEYRFRRKDGEYRWVRDEVVVVRDAEGRPVEVVGNWTDITERKQAEAELQHHRQHLEVSLAERSAALEQATGDLAAEAGEREQAEHALRRSEERYRQLFNSVTDMILVHGIEPDGSAGRFVEANAAACQRLGYTREELLRMGVADIQPPSSAVDASAIMAQVRDHRTALFETVGLTKDGRQFPVEVSAELFELEGQPVVLTLARDLTERKEAEKKLREQHHILKDILEATLSGYWDWDIPRHAEYLSPSFKKMFGYEDHELPNLPETWQELIVPEDLPGVLQVYDRHVKSHGTVPYYNEVRYRHKNGSTVWVICAGRVTEWDEQGNPLRMVGCHVDITARKQAEQEYKTIVQTAIDGFYVADTEGRILEVNAAYCKMSGYSREELLRMRIPDVEAAETQEETKRHIEKIIAEGGDRFQTRHRRKDGQVLDVQASVQYLSLRGGIFIVFVQDISERKRAEEALELEAVRLQAQLELHKLMDASREQIFDLTLEAIKKVTQSQFAFIGLMDKAEAVMTIHAWSKNAMAQCAVETMPRRFPVSEAGLWGESVRQRQPVIVNAYADSPDKKGTPAGHVPIERFMAVPIFDGERIVAVAAAANKTGDYTESDSAALILLTERLWGILRRKQAEEALRETNQRLQLVLNSTGDGIYGIGPDGNCTLINRAALAMLGYASPEEVLGRNNHELFHHSHADGSPYAVGECPIYQALRGQTTKAVGTEVFWRKDGTSLPVEYRAHPIEEGGQVIGCVVSFTDITERKRAEEALRKRSEELAAFNEAMVDREARIIEMKEEVNALCQELGREPEYPPVWKETGDR